MVLPDPEGAEKMMSFSNVLREDFQNVKVGNLERNHQMAVCPLGKIGENYQRKKCDSENRQEAGKHGKKIIFFWGVGVIFVFCLNVAKLF